MTALKLGLIGHPLSHSVSPQLHQIFLDATGLNGSYELIDLPTEQLLPWFESGEYQQYQGLNVTIPHKTQLFNVVQDAGLAAKLTGAVNTLYINANQHLVGENTDVDGFEASLPTEVINQLPNSTVLIMGAGGAARAVAYVLMKNYAAQIILKVRPTSFYQPALKALEATRQMLSSSTRLLVCNSWDNPGLRPERLLMLVNTTPLGMASHAENDPSSHEVPLAILKKLRPKCTVYDLVYNPLQTPLLQNAESCGIKTIGGLSMLVHQGAKAFEYWTGKAIDKQTIELATTTLAANLAKTAETITA